MQHPARCRAMCRIVVRPRHMYFPVFCCHQASLAAADVSASRSFVSNHNHEREAA
jgi:hypothetical protein